VSLPLPLPVPLRVSFSLPFPSPFLTALQVIHTVCIVILIGIARPPPFTARRTVICPIVTIIILVGYRIQLQWSNGQDVAWVVHPAAWQLNHCTGIIATLPREMLTSVFNPPLAGCLPIGAINLITEGTWVVPPQNLHFFMCSI
jgi:hypothetical protein